MAKTVLIVEDNELNMKLFHDLLEAHGYNTIGTRNVISANFRGVLITGPNATGNVIQDNFIGTTFDASTLWWICWRRER